MEEHVKIDQPYLILVEGKDDLHFLIQVANKIELSKEIDFKEIGGKTDLKDKLEAIKLAESFDSCVSLGIVRDKDKDPDPFKGVCDALRANELPVPEKELSPSDGNPRVILFIMPGQDEPGALEDLCLKSVEDKPEMECVEEYMGCLNRVRGKDHSKPSKAKLHAYLASMEEPGKPIGIAVQKNYLPFDSTAFEDARRFLELVAGTKVDDKETD